MAARRLSDLAKQILGFGKSADEMARQQTAAELEATLAQQVKDGKIPHAIVYATNKDGSFYYHHSAGLQNYGINDTPIEDDPPIMLASQTKLLTAISVLKAVELNLIQLDDDVSTIIHELGQQQILTGFDDNDQPILTPRTSPITLRQLCTHSSGAAYSFHPKLMRYQSHIGHSGAAKDLAPTIPERYTMPLVFQPGTSWMYSPGLDWAGLVLERITHTTLETFQHTHLFPNLNLTQNDITYWPKSTTPPLTPHIPTLVLRTDTSTFKPNTTPHVNTHSVDAMGGVGQHARLSAYLRVLRSLLANDGALLKPESVEVLFAPQLDAQCAAALNSTFYGAGFNAWCPGVFNAEVPAQHGLGGVVFLADDQTVGGRRKGTLSWGGMFNPFWAVDRESGLAWTVGTQVLPPGDEEVKEVTGGVERAIYKMLNVGKG